MYYIMHCVLVSNNEMKKQLISVTPKPNDKMLFAASLIFTPPDNPVDLNDYSKWRARANWKHTHGRGSSKIIRKEANYFN